MANGNQSQSPYVIQFSDSSVGGMAGWPNSICLFIYLQTLFRLLTVPLLKEVYSNRD